MNKKLSKAIYTHTFMLCYIELIPHLPLNSFNVLPSNWKKI